MKKSYDTVDIAKLILSLFVVAIHSDPLYDVSEWANAVISQGVARLAVPFFFLASSFFLFKSQLTKKRVEQYCSRILCLYLCWFIITLPITIYNRFVISNHGLFISLLLFLKSFFVTSTFSGSWYLTASVFSAVLFYNLSKLKKHKTAIVLTVSVFCYLLCVASSAYGKLISYFGFGEYYSKFTMVFAKPYTSILVGVPYFACSWLIAEKPELTKKISPVWTIVLIGLLLIEVVFVKATQIANSSDCYLLLLPTAVCLFANVLNTNREIRYAKQCRYCSTIIYFAQFIWIFVLEFAEYLMNVRISHMMKFYITIVFCFITAFMIKKLEVYRPFRWMKKLY